MGGTGKRNPAGRGPAVAGRWESAAGGTHEPSGPSQSSPHANNET